MAEIFSIDTQAPKQKKQPGMFLGCLLVILILPFVPIIVAILLINFIVMHIVVYALVWLIWLPRGKNVLFVSSDSPIWKDYMTSEILPLVRERAVILNWSERARWSSFSLAVQVFRTLGGDREFNPLVVVFRPLRLAREFRFWPAFKSWKHGNKSSVEGLRQELLNELRPKGA